MNKEVKPEVKCECCGGIKEHAKYEDFCDQCQRLLPRGMYPLTLRIFHGNNNTENIDLCSWQCVKDYLVANKDKFLSCEFIDLPLPVFRDQSFDGSKARQYCDSGVNFLKVFFQINPKEGTPK